MRPEVDHAYVEHLSRASQRKSFDPYRDIDWNVPFDDSRFYVPADMVSLYGTPLWERMSREERVRLSMHEAASVMAQGIWFENILNFKMTAYLYRTSPHDPNFYWMHREVADECRHQMMFGEFIRRSGAPWYKPRWWAFMLGNTTRFIAAKVSVFVGILAAEQTTDYLNRRVASDEECHPVMRQISRIHLIEEARHLGYARRWLEENFPRLPALTRMLARVEAPITTGIILSQLISPEVYRNVGLPPDAVRIARRNPARRRMRQAMCAELTGFFEQIGIVNKSTAPRWRAMGLLA
jgi:para-aminobenzoate N-oxygenase AurF